MKKGMPLKAVLGAVKSSRTPEYLKTALIKKYGEKLKKEFPSIFSNPKRKKNDMVDMIEYAKLIGKSTRRFTSGDMNRFYEWLENKKQLKSKNPLWGQKHYWVGIPWKKGRRSVVKPSEGYIPGSFAKKYSSYQWFEVSAHTRIGAHEKALKMRSSSLEPKELKKVKRRKKNIKIPAKMLAWREKQKHGSVMRPSTFKKIEQKAKKAGYMFPKAVAGSAYWKTLRAKYRDAKYRDSKKNPKRKINLPIGSSSMVEIYSDALETHGKKGPNSIYHGQEFMHKWETPGTKILGLPTGTKIELPDGNAFELTTRSVLMDGKKDLWDDFEQ